MGCRTRQRRVVRLRFAATLDCAGSPALCPSAARKEDLILRVQRPVTPALLNTLNDRFASICLNGGRFVASEPLPDEATETGLPPLYRILFPFNRTNYGRLRTVIDAINQH